MEERSFRSAAAKRKKERPVAAAEIKMTATSPIMPDSPFIETKTSRSATAQPKSCPARRIPKFNSSNTQKFLAGLCFGLVTSTMFIGLVYLIRLWLKRRRQARSKVLTEFHLERIRTRKWLEVIKWARKYQHQAKLRDRRGNSCLHYALLYRPPPLAIRALMDAQPFAPMMKNSDGELPLHWCFRGVVPIDIIKTVLWANPTGATTLNKAGESPFHLLRIKLLENFIEQRSSDNDDGDGNESSIDVEDFDDDVKVVWNKMMMLLQMAYHGTLERTLPPNVKWRPLHAAVGVMEYLPTKMLAVLLTCLVKGVSDVDEEGRLPLHIACSSTKDQAKFKYVTNRLIEMCPEAVDKPDGDGDLPLKIAMRSISGYLGGMQAIIDAESKLRDTPRVDMVKILTNRRQVILHAIDINGSERKIEQTVERNGSHPLGPSSLQNSIVGDVTVTVDMPRGDSMEPFLDSDIDSFASPSMVMALKEAEELLLAPTVIEEENTSEEVDDQAEDISVSSAMSR